MTPQRPVQTRLSERPAGDPRTLHAHIVLAPIASTPSGQGAGSGRLCRLPELDGASLSEPAIVIVENTPFDVAAAALRRARDRGWMIAGVLVDRDDAVLIGNRFDRQVPILDLTPSLGRLVSGARAAVEVASAGSEVSQLSDPLALGTLLGARHPELATAALLVREVRCAAVVTHRTVSTQEPETPPLYARIDHTWSSVDPGTPLPPVGSVSAIRDSHGRPVETEDAAWWSLSGDDDSPGLRRRIMLRRPLVIATLSAESEERDLAGVLAAEIGCPVTVRASEAAAAARGAATTPGAPPDPLVCDLGGGTVDVHDPRGGFSRSAAGAGWAVTRLCQELLDTDLAQAEAAKRRPGVRVETPWVLEGEDGGRTFVTEPAPAAAVAHLCLHDDGALIPLTTTLGVRQWRRLRRDTKRRVLLGGARRALAALRPISLQGRTMLLAGGCAEDPEVQLEFSHAFAPAGLTVARADVAGRYGRRGAVAVGLLLDSQLAESA
jgi:Diol dehydratase reactivase ATPase-like domain/DD-reactivating factor swiveling domain